MPTDDHSYDHLPVSLDDSDIGFLGQLELSGVDVDMVDMIAHQNIDVEFDIIYPESDHVDIIYPDDSFETIEHDFENSDQAAQAMIDMVGTGRRRSPPTTSTPNRRPGQPAGVPNTTHSPRGVGRARVDPATSMRQANIMDIFPVEVHGCHCEVMDRNHGEWLNPAQNTHGQSVKLTARVMPEIEKFFQYVAGRGDFPYKTVEDIVRHAVNRHCEWLNRQEPMPQHFLVAVRQLNTIMRDEMMQAEIEENLPGLIKMATDMVKRGFVKQASGILSRVRESIAAVTDEEHRQQLQTTYQKLMTMLVDETRLRFPGGIKRELLTGSNEATK